MNAMAGGSADPVVGDIFCSSYVIKPGTLVAYRIFPSENFQDSLTGVEPVGCKDWSAWYAQFSLEHVLSYLPNRYDNGAEVVSLCAIYAKKPILALICTGNANKHI